MLPEPLTWAFDARPPGEPRPPGPRVNPWAAAGALRVEPSPRERALLDGMWRADGVHRRADGTATTIGRRPVPSAGAAYPVQTHLVVGAGEALAPGRYVHDHESGLLRRRDPDADAAAGWDRPGRPREGTRLVLTVQPGRSFGRYRQRAWPLWIADAAYALAAAEFLLAAPGLVVRLGPGAGLRSLLAVPRAGHAQRWLARGLVPEIPLAALDLPPSWTVDAERSRALRRRRSPPIAEFRAAGPGQDAAHAERLAGASGQDWVRGAARLRSWSVSTTASAAELATALWRAHRTAAAGCYASALSERWRCRPVSGFSAGADGCWTIHALACLPGPCPPGKETGAC
ncbi:nitroreductase family protein [Jiangella endophytica]|uniref:hypothetical protein n=1 Tax=Jiangella endophytica TaxID=1623398 RepID=UPI0013003CA3|nr:hypothetical protein [Jiangella endophytica]